MRVEVSAVTGVFSAICGRLFAGVQGRVATIGHGEVLDVVVGGCAFNVFSISGVGVTLVLQGICYRVSNCVSLREAFYVSHSSLVMISMRLVHSNVLGDHAVYSSIITGISLHGYQRYPHERRYRRRARYRWRTSGPFFRGGPPLSIVGAPDFSAGDARAGEGGHHADRVTNAALYILCFENTHPLCLYFGPPLLGNEIVIMPKGTAPVRFSVAPRQLPFKNTNAFPRDQEKLRDGIRLATRAKPSTLHRDLPANLLVFLFY